MDAISYVQLASWTTMIELLATFSLIFGGCCSNALTLEMITSQYPPAGTVITLAQFLFVALFGLRKQLLVLPRRIPRQEAIRRVAEMSIGARANVISIYGPDEHASLAFAQEVASAVGGTFSDSLDETLVRDAPADPLPGIKRPFNIVRPSSNGENLPYYFRVLLQKEPVLSHILDAVIDISAPNQPTLLHPRVFELAFNPFRYRLKRRKIPLLRYAVQVVLFLLISLLNNAAFSYHVPMAVHIIFRSGGLVVNMLLGWAFERRRYSRIQVVSVILVTLGVILTTFSSTQPKNRSMSKTLIMSDASSIPRAESISYSKYAIGIAILSLALLLSGILGITQDRTFERYGRGNWEEAMFYLHALALPLFGFTWSELAAQVREVNSGPQITLSKTPQLKILPPLPYIPKSPPTLRIPAFYIPLVLNVLTQLLCVAGVNRLTSRVNSLTVALVLVVRKAVSLAVSVLLLGGSHGNTYLWAGATAVLVGTVGYTLGSGPARTKVE